MPEPVKPGQPIATPVAAPAEGDVPFNNELAENFFEQQEQDKEDAFQAQFKEDIPQVLTDEVGGFADETVPPVAPVVPVAPVLDAQGKVIPPVAPVLDADGNVIPPVKEPFKFDETLEADEKAELAELNLKLNTNFKSRAELDAAMKKSDNAGQVSEVDDARRHVTYFDKMMKYDDNKLVYEDKVLTAEFNKQDINDPDVLAVIKAEVVALEEGQMIGYAAQSVRGKIQGIINTKSKIVTDYDTAQLALTTKTATQIKEGLQNAVNELNQQGTFMGITLNDNMLMDVYKDVSKNNHIAHLKANPIDAIKFGIFKKYEKEISTLLDKPNFKDGVQAALKEIGLANPDLPVKPAVASHISPTETASYLDDILK